MTEREKQRRYWLWMQTIAKAKKAIHEKRPLAEIQAITSQAADHMRGVSPKWVTQFQDRPDYPERMREVVGNDDGPALVEYMRNLWTEPS
jgi:hypothetical protein